MKALTSIRSRFGPKETMNRLEVEIRAHGMKVCDRSYHAAGAAEAGFELRPTELIIFGNARGGTPLMQSAQTVGIDLPLKALVWEDASGTTWLSYNEPSWLAHRRGVANAAPVVSKMSAALSAMARKITENAAQSLPTSKEGAGTAS